MIVNSPVVIETPRYSGYTPERLGEALEFVNTLDVNAIVLEGMASGIHDKMMDLHKRFERSLRHQYPDTLSKEIERLGWDIGSFDSQKPNHDYWPENAESNTTIDIRPAGEAVDWHVDTQASGYELYLPYGYSVSINLGSYAVFCVETEYLPFELKNGPITYEDRDEIMAQGAYSEPIESYAEAIIGPGDVLLWRQPSSHSVNIFDDQSSSIGRRAIVFIKEDLVVIEKTNDDF